MSNDSLGMSADFFADSSYIISRRRALKTAIILLWELTAKQIIKLQKSELTKISE